MRPVHLLIALRTQYQFDREAFISIARCAHTYSNVFLHLKHPEQDFRSAVAATGAHGMIVSTSSPRELDEVASAGLPSVNVANYLEGHARVPVVGNDDAAIARMIADYFLDRGFQQFAYFADANMPYFHARRDAFVAAVEAAGFECHIGPPAPPPAPEPARAAGGRSATPAPPGPAGDATRVAREADGPPPAHVPMSTEQRGAPWLASLPKPLAVMSPYDSYARHAVHACQLAQLRVPEEVSVIGVDDDPMLCMTIWPQIASVATSAGQIGRAALELVQAMVNGQPPPAAPLLFAPSEVVVRGSCSELAITDRDVAAAVNFIRTHVRERLTVASVSHHVAVSRRTLERKFLEILRRSPSDEIRRARVAQAKRLLIESDLALPEVARRSGLIRAQRLSNLLKQDCGLTPVQFRARFRRAD